MGVDMAKNRNRRCGFTLIELLVVIAIISLLVSILLPSLQSARELAKKAVCMTTMRSIGSATHTYSAEFDDFFPSINDATYGLGSDTDYSMCVYTWMTGGTSETKWDGYYTEISGTPTEDRVLYSFLESGEAWKCPSDDDNVTFWQDNYPGKGAPTGYYNVYGSSYGFNGNAMGQDHTPNVDRTVDGLWGKKRADTNSPAMLVEYYEFTVSWSDVGLRAHDKNEWYCNFLFADGHVGSHLMETDSAVYFGGENGFTFDFNH